MKSLSSVYPEWLFFRFITYLSYERVCFLMEELISLLRDTRKKKNIDLEDISAQTRLQVSQLEALEKGDFSCFAGEVYLKGSIKLYARSVGLESNEVMELYYKIREQKREQLIQEGKEKKKKEKVKLPKEKDIKKQETMSLFSTVIYTIIFLLVFAGIWVFLSEDRGNDNPYDREITENGEGLTLPEEAVSPDDEEIMPEEDEEEKDEKETVEIVLIESTYSTSRWDFRGDDKINVRVVMEGNCWIDMYVDNRNVHQKTFTRGNEIDVSAEKEIRIRLGNPPAVKMFINEIEVEGLRDKRNPHNYIITKY